MNKISVEYQQQSYFLTTQQKLLFCSIRAILLWFGSNRVRWCPHEKIRIHFEKFYKCRRSFGLCLSHCLALCACSKYFRAWARWWIYYSNFHTLTADHFRFCHRTFGFWQANYDVHEWSQKRIFRFAFFYSRLVVIVCFSNHGCFARKIECILSSAG